MARIVADSSALILLLKCSLIQMFCELFDVVVPEAVYTEVASEDLIKNYPDAALIAELTAKGAINVQNLERGDRVTLPRSLHKGEGRCVAVGCEVGKAAACHR